MKYKAIKVLTVPLTTSSLRDKTFNIDRFPSLMLLSLAPLLGLSTSVSQILFHFYTHTQPTPFLQTERDHFPDTVFVLVTPTYHDLCHTYILFKPIGLHSAHHLFVSDISQTGHEYYQHKVTAYSTFQGQHILK